jgi:hypothetical protein
LDPSSVANISMGNAGNLSRAYSNQANVYGGQAQGWQKMIGQGLAGYAGGLGGTSTTQPFTSQGFGESLAGNPYLSGMLGR